MLSHRAWTLESVLLLLMWLFTGLAGVSFGALGVQHLTAGLSRGEQMFYLNLAGSVPVYLWAVGLLAWFLRKNQLGWDDGFGLRRRWGRALLLAAGVAILVTPANLTLLWVSQKILEWCSISLEVQTPVEAVLLAPAIWQKAVLGLVSVVCAPVIEELFFRGIIYPSVKQAGFPRLALWGTALFFAVSHANLMAFLPLAFFGVVLALLYEATDNLLAPIATHALFNAFNYLWLVVAPGNS